MPLEYYRANNTHINNTMFTLSDARDTGVLEVVFTPRCARGKAVKGLIHHFMSYITMRKLL